jgi:hypothetical protein
MFIISNTYMDVALFYMQVGKSNTCRRSRFPREQNRGNRMIMQARRIQIHRPLTADYGRHSMIDIQPKCWYESSLTNDTADRVVRDQHPGF